MPVSRRCNVSHARNSEVSDKIVFGKWLYAIRPVVTGASTISFNRMLRKQDNPVQDDMRCV